MSVAAQNLDAQNEETNVINASAQFAGQIAFHFHSDAFTGTLTCYGYIGTKANAVAIAALDLADMSTYATTVAGTGAVDELRRVDASGLTGVFWKVTAFTSGDIDIETLPVVG